MMDREDVIKGLGCRAEDNDFPCFLCAYYKPDEKPVARCDYRGLMNDAIALLKEQEAVEPEVEVLNEVDRLYKCPKCHKHFFYRKQKYCDQCGQAVKWDGRSKSV